MAQQHINTGSALGAGDGDTLRQAAIKMEDNFTDLYPSFSAQYNLFPFTVKFRPAQVVGSAGGDTTLGITGSVFLDHTLPGGPQTPFFGSISASNAFSLDFKENYIGSISNRGAELSHHPFNRESTITFGSSSEDSDNVQIEDMVFSVSSSTLTSTNPSKMIELKQEENISGGTTKYENNLYRDLTYIAGKGPTTLITTLIRDDQRRVGFHATASDHTSTLTVGGDEFTSASNFEFDPTEYVNNQYDPRIEGKLYYVTGDDIYGNGSTDQVLCISRGPNSLPTKGLLYMWAPGITGSGGDGNSSIYRSFRPTNETFFSAVRTGSAWTSGSFETATFENPSGFAYVISNSFREQPVISFTTGFPSSTVSSSVVLWVKYPFVNNAIKKIMGGHSNFEIEKRNNIDDLFLNFGGGGSQTGNKIPDFFTSGGLDDWHMYGFSFEGNSGAGNTFKTFVRTNSFTKWVTNLETSSSFASNPSNFTNVLSGDTNIKGISIGRSVNLFLTSDISSSLFMYYTGSLTYDDYDTIYNYFSASHGLDP